MLRKLQLHLYHQVEIEIVVFSHHVLRNDGQLSLTAERFQQSHSDMQLKHPENHTKQ